MQCRTLGPSLLLGQLTHDGGDSPVVYGLGFLAREEIFPALLGEEQVNGCTEVQAVKHKF